MHADQTPEFTFSALQYGRRFALATIAALLLCTSAAHAAELVPTLFGVPAGAKTAGPAAVAPIPDRAVARTRSVTVEFKYLDPRSDKAATAIGVELFDGQFVIVDRAGIDERGPGSYAWHGKVRGYGHSDAILTVVDGQIAGSI